MYQNSFWDTVAGQRLASVLTDNLPKFTEKKQYIERVRLKRLPEFLKRKLEAGYRYIDSFEDPDDPAYRQVILEKSIY